MSVRRECRKADLLAARFYKLAEGDRDRAARDWLNQVKKAVDAIKLAEKCRKKSTSNKGFLRISSKNVENVEQNVEAETIGIID